MTDNENAATQQSEAGAKGQTADGQAPEPETDTVDITQPSAEELKALADDNWARYMRTAAALENLRKRSERDLEHARKYGHEKFAAEMLAVKDSLELGLAAAEDSTGAESLLEGTRMTLKLMEQGLEKFGVVPVEPLGEPFDPDLHEAMAMLEAPNEEPNTVMQVLQKGYQINGRLLRPARVIVARAAET